MNPLVTEYKDLGETLKTFTVKDIAGKFDLTTATLKAVLNIDTNDIQLMQDLLNERKEMLQRRKDIRKKIGNWQIYNV